MLKCGTDRYYLADVLLTWQIFSLSTSFNYIHKGLSPFGVVGMLYFKIRFYCLKIAVRFFINIVF